MGALQLLLGQLSWLERKLGVCGAAPVLEDFRRLLHLCRTASQQQQQQQQSQDDDSAAVARTMMQVQAAGRAMPTAHRCLPAD